MSPLRVLLRVHLRRSNSLMLGVGVLLVSCLLAWVMTLNLAQMDGARDPGSVGLLVVAVLLIGLLPMVLGSVTSKALQAMRKGRFVEDAALTGMTPREIVDGLIGYQVLYAGLAGVLFYVPTGLWLAAHHEGELGPLVVSLWLPLYASMTLAIAYVGQLTSDDDVRFWPRLALMIFWISSIVGIIVALSIPSMGLGIAVCGELLGGAFLARLWLLQRLSGAEPLVRSQARPVNPWMTARDANPIVRREMMLASRRVPFGLPGMLLWRFGMILFLPLLLAQRDYEVMFTFGALAFVQMLRVVWTMTGCILRERQRNTLEVLHETQVGAREFVNGWLTFAVRDRLIEMAVLGLPLLHTSYFHQIGVVVVLTNLLKLLVVAYVGVIISSRIKSLANSGMAWIGAYWIYGICSLPATLIGLWTLGVNGVWPVSILWMIVSILALRHLAYREAARVGFSLG